MYIKAGLSDDSPFFETISDTIVGNIIKDLKKKQKQKKFKYNL